MIGSVYVSIVFFFQFPPELPTKKPLANSVFQKLE